MNRLLLISILMIGALLFSMTAKAQTTRLSPHDSRNDISAGFGWMIPMVQGELGSDFDEGSMVRVDYRHFYQNRSGFGIGIQHVKDYMNVDGSIGMPLSFVCRSELRDFGEVVGRGVKNAMEYDPFEDYDANYMQEYVDHPLAEGFLSDIGVFLVSIVNRAEFRAGLTPGYIYGDGRTHRSSFSVISEGYRYDWSGVKGTEVGSRYCLTADVGANLSYRIWRFCLNLNPELHYIITNSYNIYSKPDKGVAETRPQRWQFSFMFSFDLML